MGGAAQTREDCEAKIKDKLAERERAGVFAAELSVEQKRDAAKAWNLLGVGETLESALKELQLVREVLGTGRRLLDALDEVRAVRNPSGPSATPGEAVNAYMKGLAKGSAGYRKTVAYRLAALVDAFGGKVPWRRWGWRRSAACWRVGQRVTTVFGFIVELMLDYVRGVLPPGGENLQAGAESNGGVEAARGRGVRGRFPPGGGCGKAVACGGGDCPECAAAVAIMVQLRLLAESERTRVQPSRQQGGEQGTADEAGAAKHVATGAHAAAIKRDVDPRGDAVATRNNGSTGPAEGLAGHPGLDGSGIGRVPGVPWPGTD